MTRRMLSDRALFTLTPLKKLDKTKQEQQQHQTTEANQNKEKVQYKLLNKNLKWKQVTGLKAREFISKLVTPSFSCKDYQMRKLRNLFASNHQVRKCKTTFIHFYLWFWVPFPKKYHFESIMSKHGDELNLIFMLMTLTSKAFRHETPI